MHPTLRAALLTGLTTAACATASRSPPALRTRADQDFLVRARSLGRFQVESSLIALERDPPEATLRFARRLARDGVDAERSLFRLIPESAPLRARDQMRLDRLRAARGDDFDDLFRRFQVGTLEDALALHERCAHECGDPEVRGYAARMLPVLQRDLVQVEDLVARAER